MRKPIQPEQPDGQAGSRVGKCCLLAALCLTGGGAAAEPVVHRYTVTVDSGLERLGVEAHFARPVTEIRARSRDADDYIDDARNCESGAAIGNRGRRLRIPGTGIACLAYKVDLEGAAREYRYNARLAPDNVVVSSSLWMWRPALDPDTTIRVEFRLPDNVRVSVPWRPLDREAKLFELAASPESSHAPVAFGRLDNREIPVPGATLRVTLLRGREAMDTGAIVNWLAATGTDVSLAYGRFPNPSPQVVVVPVGDSRRNSRSAVPFGRVIRDGGETVELLVDQGQPLDRLLSDWTATHEFSHLMLPYLDGKYRWISEGFAQYYQNVLLTRSGAYEPQQAWQKIYDGYGRGSRARPDLSPNEAASRRARASLMKMYWSGAAIALLADVELRERSGGEQSLDTVLSAFQACCLPSARVWDGPELFARFDEIAGEPVFTPLYRAHADTAGFPDTGGVFRRLGLAVSGGRVELEDGAELQAIRDSILAPDPATATWRRELAAD